MPDFDRLSGVIVESLLTAIAYSGEDAAPLFTVLDAAMFDGLYRDVAERLLEFRQRYKKPPAPAHLDDIFDDILRDPDHKHYRAYNRILVGIREQAPSLNVKFLVDRVVTFARQQRLKNGVLLAAERYQRGGDGTLDDVERILLDALRQRVANLDVGDRMNINTLDFLDQDDVVEGSKIKIDIDELDKRGLVPTRGELYYILAPRKKGKSWGLQSLCKAAVMGRWNAVYISLENRRPTVKMRFVQSFFSAAKRREPFIKSSFGRDSSGFLDEISYRIVEPEYALYDPEDRAALNRMVWQHKQQFKRLLIMEFPSGTLTVQALDNWLDMVEGETGFVPDLLALDYPQLMKLDNSDMRISYGRTTVELRGLAGRRNLALCAAMQGNRESEDAKILRSKHVAEDISQIATADTVISYNQTEAEKRHNIARLHVVGARTDEDGFTILVSQSYKTGQWYLDSIRMGPEYWEIVTESDARLQRERPDERRAEKVTEE